MSAESSAIASSAFAVSRAARLSGGEPASQDLVLGLQGLDGGLEDAHKQPAAFRFFAPPTPAIRSR